MTVRVERPDGSAVCDRCGVAETPLRRMRGLLGKPRLQPGEGLLLRPAPAIQTWFLRFPVDAVFLDRDTQVVAIRKRLRPFRTAGDHRARSVLELPAGEIDRQGISVGERLRLVWPDEVVAASRNGGNERAPLRVALATTDPRFLRVASFLLARQGYGVEAKRDQADLLDLVRRRGADVAVIDGSGSLTAAARTTRAIEGLDPTVGVVVVAERNGATLPRNLRVVDKWAAFDSIVDQIEAAHSTATGLA